MRRRKGLLGQYALFPMRNAIFVAHSVLDGCASYSEVKQFYDTVRLWREWIREHAPPNPPSTRRPDAEYGMLRDYQNGLRKYADGLIELLQLHLEEKRLSFVRPPLPVLPE